MKAFLELISFIAAALSLPDQAFYPVMHCEAKENKVPVRKE